MLLNLLILAFVILMAYYWGAVQGLMSGFLHLVAVIAAGALAIALWEPLVLGFLMNRMPAYAWCVGLAGPFILWLVILRTAFDKAVPGNMHFSQLINALVGGALGLLAGILTAGLVLIAVGMLPLPVAIMGWQPLVVENGRPRSNPQGGLWVPVDRMTGSFYGMLSQGALAPGFPSWNGNAIPHLRGDLARGASLVRLRPDPNASIVTTPATVSVLVHYEHTLPIESMDSAVAKALGVASLGPASDQKLTVIDTAWDKRNDGTYDIDGALRLPPNQVQLIAQRIVLGQRVPETFLPQAVGRLEQNKRAFVAFSDESTVARLAGKGQLAWAFVLPGDMEPTHILLRGVRLKVNPPVRADSDQVLAALGELPRPEGDAALAQNGDGRKLPLGSPPPGRHGAVGANIQITAALPQVISSNAAGSLRLENNRVVSGRSDVNPPGQFLSVNTRVETFLTYPTEVCVRVKVERNDAQSIFGRAITSARMLQPIYLTDAAGGQILPSGFVLQRGDGTQRISMDRTGGIQSARELPIAEMNEPDNLYLYFLVPRGTRITAFNMGPAVRQDVNLETGN